MAKTISCIYKSESQLHRFIDSHELCDYPNLLVQVFSGNGDRDNLKKVQLEVNGLLPQVTMIGCTTSGEILNGNIVEDEIVLSFTIFEKTELKSIMLNLDEYSNSYDLGTNLVRKISSFDTKAIILFITDFSVDVPLLLEAIHNEKQDVVIAGGVAGDNGAFKEGLVFTNHELTNQGVVAVALNSEQLKTKTFTNYKWQEIGKSFSVTKASGSTIYQIDQKKPIQILRHYLGDDFVNGLPQSGVEFPFILEKNGEKVSVFITRVLANGAIEVNRVVNEGETITFAYADLKEIVEHTLHELKQLSKTNVESIFVYNCMARKKFLRDFTEKELEMLNQIATTSGVFSYGEISNKEENRPQLVGHSLTYLALNESDTKDKQNTFSFQYDIPENMNTIVSLTHLMKASQHDIKMLNDHLTISEQYYRSLFDNNADFVYSTDLKGNFTSVNPAFVETFGFNEKEIIGNSALKYIKNEDIARVRMHFYRALKGKEQYYNIEIPTKSGEVYLFQIRNIPITIQGETVGIYGIGRNITEQKKIEEKIIQLAYFDQETGLPNRMKFTEKLEEFLQRAKKKKRMLAVMIIDMDRFKIINDSLGHYAGDVILKEVSERIQKVLPSGSFFGRFSGDKFTLVLSKNVNMEEVMKVANSILFEVAKPVYYKNQEFVVTASIGVSLFPNDGLDENTLMKNADIAMNRSKNPGGNRITFFSNEMNEQAMARLELESYLRKALQKNEFYLCYQPLVDLATGKTYGSEALIRWNHPKLGLVSPMEFIPLAEETGLIEEIGSWVLRTACMQNKKWQLMGMHDLSISVNVSANQFSQPGFLREVVKALDDSGLEPEYLTLELTESIMLRNIDYSISVMKALQELGVKVSIDDFGTGYSSLSYLKNLPINTLKIDRSFINNLRLNTSDIAIVKAIITMGHGLAVKVVAEGVETKEQIELLKELKCHYAQGYYIHKPLSSDDFEKGLLATPQTS
ncbi:EAL domain-containing protein [Bacillus sp. 31A1R]|uniref:EAL domain-containing protein n=1 Tax=Robertmurraya mangrovi TaxID=3098077 RepID=A0ABU5IT12_9BACI|nr:EAL domain-containing protein [Bacillus sp. 31A1R]MDZ5470280.1 EAL domain-containing protein [Bacillus sp. 31A1R]